ncbi:hypothetical protein [Pelagovum sp. HNIBRBA483]|uniref:hypothetical protein n=1 Tax=Pelagovum sp. HNIBRBA483 TaxID=3233341 RepID=UPI0034A29390
MTMRLQVLSGAATVALAVVGNAAFADSFSVSSNSIAVTQGASAGDTDFLTQFYWVMQGNSSALPGYQEFFSEIYTGESVVGTGFGGVGNKVSFDVLGTKNAASVSQSGNYNEIATDQSGESNTIWALQSGNDATGTIMQSGGAGNLAALAQIGTVSEENGTYTFGADGVSFADMYQTGNFNIATLTQLGNAGLSSAVLTQSGDANNISVILGAGGTSSVGAFDANNPLFDTNLLIEQSGDENNVVMTAADGMASATIRQNGDFNFVDASVSGADNVIDLTQTGQSSVTIRQLGDFNVFDATIDGTGNEIDLEQNGGASFTATVTGNGNVIGALADMTGSYAGTHQAFVQAAGATAVIDVQGDDNALMLDQSDAATLYLSVGAATGGANEVYVSQAGLGAVADLSLYGQNNTLRVSQTAGAVYGLHTDGVTYGQAIVDLTGNGNDISIAQSARGYASITGSGNRNDISIEQTVDYVSALVTVDGNNLKFDLVQDGSSTMSVVVEELTNGKVAKVCQGRSCR